MQKSDQNEGKHKKRVKLSTVTLACPRCGNQQTRISLTKATDGLLSRMFRKSYRCQACRHRFWVMDRSRLIWFACIILALVPVIGFVWIMLNKQSAVPNSSQVAYYDQIKILAEKGDAEAELQMGLRYTSIADEKIAAQWFEKAAQHGKVLAQYRYGLALLKGQGVVQDYKKASYWLEKAARKGNAEAQFSLGEMYHSDMGIIRDNPERAYLWFNLAAAQGLEKAASARDLVVQMLTRDQIAAMQEEANRISRNQYSGPEVTESEAELKEHVSGVADKPAAKVSEPKAELKERILGGPDKPTATANEPTVESKKHVPGDVDKSSVNVPIPGYRYSGLSLGRKKVGSKENVQGVEDNRYPGQLKRTIGSKYLERIASRNKVKSKTRTPKVEEKPSTNSTMSGLNSSMPRVNGQMSGVNGQIPGAAGQIPGVDVPLPGMEILMPGVNDSRPGMNGPMTGFQRPLSSLKRPRPSLNGSIQKEPIQNDRLPPVKY